MNRISMIACGILAVSLSAYAFISVPKVPSFNEIRDTIKKEVVDPTVNVIKNPTPENIATATIPAAAAAKKIDQKTGVTPTLRHLARLPGNANQTLGSVKDAADNAKGAIDDGKKRIERLEKDVSGVRKDVAETRLDINAFLAKISLPSQALLWGLVALVGFKLVKIVTLK